MASETNPTPSDRGTPGRTLLTLLTALAPAMAIAAALLFYFYGRRTLGEAVTLLVGAAILLGARFLLTKAVLQSLRESETARLRVLVMGGSLGFLVTVAVLIRTYLWWSFVAGGLETWRGPEGWRIWLLVLGMLTGLAIMFATLLGARSEEQSNAVLRRMLYGYNAFLSCYLLLAILGLLNVLAYAYVPAVSDWTDSKIYTLNPRSVNILRGLDKPVTVYVIFSSRGETMLSEVQNLLDNCRNVTDKIQVEYLYRDRNLRALDQLIQKYKLVNDTGLLVVYGNESDAGHQFIKGDELFERPTDPNQPLQFKGEDALMTAITFLQEGQKKAIVYFTQANGELDVSDSGREQPARSGRVLRDLLEKANYEVKGLQLAAPGANKGAGGRVVSAAQVPDDAAVVIVAGPHTTFAPQAVEALRTYMNPVDPKKPRGKLIVLLDVVTNLDGAMVPSGLESFLASFSVEVGNDRILGVSERAPESVLVEVNTQLRSTNPVAAGLENIAFPMDQCRTVSPSKRPPAGPGPAFQADILLVAEGPSGPVWAEKDLRSDPMGIVKEILASRRKQEELRPYLPIGVAVTEAAGPDPSNPHAFMEQGKGQKPRLLVLGNARFASDEGLQRYSARGRGVGYPFIDLVSSSLAWLRERPNSIGLDPKNRKVFMLSEKTNVSRMIHLPTVVMLLCIFGMGFGVWVVRRR